MNALIDRMRQQQNEMLVITGINDDLTYAEIVNRVKIYIENLERLKSAYAYGDTDFDDPNLQKENVYDPIAFLEAEPDEFEALMHMVAHDVEHYLSIIIARKDDCSHSYNILLFACAMHVANSKTIPEDLQPFLVDHLLNPTLGQKKHGPGRRKRPEIETKLIGSAVSFAKSHGLTATRNDASVEKMSACDAVGEAVSELMREKRTKLSCSNYDAIQKIWQKYRKLA